MKQELATVMADLILQNPKRAMAIIEYAECAERSERKEFLDPLYRNKIEDIFGHNSWDINNPEEFWTLERLRAAPIEKHILPSRGENDYKIQEYIRKLSHDTDTARQALRVILSEQSGEEKRRALIDVLKTITGHRSLLDMGSYIGVHYGNRTYEQGDVWDGATEEDITSVFDAAAAAMRNITEISQPRLAKGQKPYNAISIRESKEGGIKLIHQSALDSLYDQTNTQLGTPAR